MVQASTDASAAARHQEQSEDEAKKADTLVEAARKESVRIHMLPLIASPCHFGSETGWLAELKSRVGVL